MMMMMMICGPVTGLFVRWASIVMGFSEWKATLCTLNYCIFCTKVLDFRVQASHILRRTQLVFITKPFQEFKTNCEITCTYLEPPLVNMICLQTCVSFQKSLSNWGHQNRLIRRTQGCLFLNFCFGLVPSTNRKLLVLGPGWFGGFESGYP